MKTSANGFYDYTKVKLEKKKKIDYRVYRN